MAYVTMSTLVLAFILFFASFSLYVQGRNLAETSEIATSQGEAITNTRIPGIMRSNSSAKKFLSTFMGQLAQQPVIKTHFTSWSTLKSKWHGTRVKINVWNINVQPKSNSAAYITLFNYESAQHAISFGVHVYPLIYGDHDLHFFTYWTVDGGNSTGCYNTECTGFVPADWSNLYPGFKLKPLSSYGGKGYYITIRIKKDENTGDWGLYREDGGGNINGSSIVGTFPKSLFNGGLADFATKIQYGGSVSYHADENETSPAMGSGHFPEEAEGKAAYLKNILTYDTNGNDYELKGEDVIINENAHDCYRVSAWMNSKDDGDYFYYGGPSGCKA